MSNKPTREQRLMVALMREMTIEELVPVMQYALCDYHQRLLAIGLIFPEDHDCDHDGHNHNEQEEEDLEEVLVSAKAVGGMQ